MIQFFRRLFSSKIGAFIALLFLGLIAFAFASSDITGAGNFGGGATGGKVAEVGSEDITSAELRTLVLRAYDNARQQQPGLDQASFINSGAFDSTLNQMIDGLTLEQYARKLGFGVSKRLVDARIAETPAFAGLDGKFSQSTFEQVLKANNLTEKQIRSSIEQQMLIEQLMTPVAAPLRVPSDFSMPYASLKLEERFGQATYIAADTYAPTTAPTDAQLNDYVTKNRARFLVPEQRVVRYALFDANSVGTPPAVTDAEITKFYEENKQAFAGTETRIFGQVIASTEAQAKTIAASAQSGSLEAAASSAGLEASEIKASKATDLAAATSDDVAKRAFAANEGSVVGPIKVPLGWAVLKLNKVDHVAARSLADARPEIEKSLAERKKLESAQDFFNKIQEQVDGGASAEELAKNNNLKLVITPAILPTGQSLENPAYRPEQILAPMVGPAFQATAAGEAQLITIKENEQFAIVDAGKIIPAAVPPLASIKDRVIADWKRAEGSRKARELARKISDRVNKGATLEDAIKAEGAKTASIQRIGAKRGEVEAAQGKAPSEIALLFSMTPQSSKTLELPNNAGWMVIHLNETKRGNAKNEPQLATAIQQQMSQSLGSDYSAQVLADARKVIGIRRNEEAIAALKKDLSDAGKQSPQ